MRHATGRAGLALAIVGSIAVVGCSAPVGVAAPGGTAPAGSFSTAAAPAVGPSATASAGTRAAAASPAQAGPATAPGAPAYTIAQATSDRAQETTIAFDALGFLTGSLATDSFFPPGKVADFFGFQYRRDNDPSGGGHATDFLTKAALDTLTILSPAQRAQLITLAKAQVDAIDAYATDRFVLMAAFRRLQAGDLPTGTSGLSEQAVEAYSAKLYALDGTLSLGRARVYGSILTTLTADQKAAFATIGGQGSASWPSDPEPTDLRGLAPNVKVAVMTYASDMFSWHAGSVTADTYFCPERQGTYFGSFYLKDAPVATTPDVSINTALTGEMGSALLSALDATQAAQIRGLIDVQGSDLAKVVSTREAIATELRRALSGAAVDEHLVASLMAEYGRLDGAISYAYATTFVRVGATLTAAQATALQALRAKLIGSLAAPTGAYLYSSPIAMPEVPSTDFLFR